MWFWDNDGFAETGRFGYGYCQVRETVPVGPYGNISPEKSAFGKMPWAKPPVTLLGTLYFRTFNVRLPLKRSARYIRTTAL
jgi:hypothetical protein